MNLLKLHRQPSSCSDYRNNNLTLVILIKPRSKLLKNAKNIPAFPKPKIPKFPGGARLLITRLDVLPPFSDRPNENLIIPLLQIGKRGMFHVGMCVGSLLPLHRIRTSVLRQKLDFSEHYSRGLKLQSCFLAFFGSNFDA